MLKHDEYLHDRFESHYTLLGDDLAANKGRHEWHDQLGSSMLKQVNKHELEAHKMRLRSHNFVEVEDNLGWMRVQGDVAASFQDRPDVSSQSSCTTSLPILILDIFKNR